MLRIEAELVTAAGHNLTGVALARQGRFADALEEFRRACRAEPGNVEAHYNLAKALKDCGKLDESIEAYRHTLSLNPNAAAAWNNVGNLLKERGKLDEAAGAYRHVLRLEPKSAEVWSNYGALLQEKKDFDGAIEAYRTATRLSPGLADVWRNLGSALYEAGAPREAIEPFERALRLRPDFVEAVHGLGAALFDIGRFDEALAAFDRGLSIRPHDVSCTYSRGLVLLLQGKLREGFAAYEARLDKKTAGCARDFPQPRWDGSDLNGRRILLHAEQGLGDTIHFIRYAPMVKERAGQVIVQCPPALVRLLQRQLEIDEIYPDDQLAPAFDVHCPMLSLPNVFATDLDNIPAQAPYLRADPTLAARWRERISGYANALKIGLVWAGGGEYRNDRLRSLTLRHLAPLMQIPAARFFSLQKGPAAIQAKDSQFANVIDWTADLTDFADTAALIANLDLVISVDTSVAHLAGALGKPTWVLLPFVPDWRWMLDRSESPWYPTMRLFRQPQLGEWDEPLKQVQQDLQRLEIRPE